MNNLLHEIELTIKGKNLGGTTGSIELDRLTLGIRKGTSGAVVAKEKVGKSKWARYHYIVQPYLKGTLKNKKYVWALFSLEEPRVKVEADVCSALIYELYKVRVSRNKMLGIELDEEGKQVKLTEKERKLVTKVYHEHITKLFGVWTIEGRQVQPGLIKFYGNKITAKQYEGLLLEFAKDFGELLYEKVAKKTEAGIVHTKEVTGFIPHDPELTPIVIMDDYRLMKGAQNKSKVDEALDVEVDITQRLRWFFFMGIIHLNREFTNFERIKAIGKNRYYPDTSLIKDTGNVGERKHFVISLFNPRDAGFETDIHFNYKVPKDNTYRSVHLIASRDVVYPQHLRSSFQGDIIHFLNYERIE